MSIQVTLNNPLPSPQQRQQAINRPLDPRRIRHANPAKAGVIGAVFLAMSAVVFANSSLEAPQPAHPPAPAATSHCVEQVGLNNATGQATLDKQGIVQGVNCLVELLPLVATDGQPVANQQPDQKRQGVDQVGADAVVEDDADKVDWLVVLMFLLLGIVVGYGPPRRDRSGR